MYKKFLRTSLLIVAVLTGWQIDVIAMESSEEQESETSTNSVKKLKLREDKNHAGCIAEGYSCKSNVTGCCNDPRETCCCSHVGGFECYWDQECSDLTDGYCVAAKDNWAKPIDLKQKTSKLTPPLLSEKISGHKDEKLSTQKKSMRQPLSIVATSDGTRLEPFNIPLVSRLLSSLSWKKWEQFLDRGLDYISNGIQSYAKNVVEDAPSYFPGMLDHNKLENQGHNKKIYNYPVPHFRTIDQGEPNHVKLVSQTQALQNTTFLQSSVPLMLPMSSKFSIN